MQHINFHESLHRAGTLKVIGLPECPNEDFA